MCSRELAAKHFPSGLTETADGSNRITVIQQGAAAPLAPVQVVEDAAHLNGDISDLSPQDLPGLLQVLRTHQRALEKQNQELRVALATAQERDADFYDVAPVGYLTVSDKALILQANLNTAALLGRPRADLIGKLLPGFLPTPDAERFSLLCQQVLASGSTQSCELHIQTHNGSAAWIKVIGITATGDDGATVIRMVLSDISERKQAEATQLTSTRLRDAILDSVPSQIAVLDYAGVILAVNDVWRRFALDNSTQPGEHASHTQMGVNYLDVCEAAKDDDSQQQARLVRDGILRVINGSAASFHLEYPCHSPSQQRWFSMAVTPLHVDQHAVVVSHTDITQSRQMEQAAKDASEKKFRLVADNTSDGIVVFGVDKRVEYVSPACAKLFGYPEAEDTHRSLEMMSELIHPQDRAGVLASLARALESGDLDLMVSYRYQHRLGHYLWREDSVRFQYDDAGHFSGACVVARDITQRILVAEKIHKLAYFDELTGLPNRALLTERLRGVLAVSARTGNCGSLLFIDMDDFRRLKNTLGHDIGNLILQQVAQRLTACVEEGDTVARLGGDEFMLVVSNLGCDELEAANKATTVAKKILLALSQPCELDNQIYHFSACIGAALYSRQSVSIDDLMKQADLAMHDAKAAGQNVLRFFDPVMELGVKQRMAMEKDLRHALEARQFLLNYQPQVQGVGLVTGAEVLVRWQHPVRGRVLPGDFIALAEETGLILALGHWVLETACAQLKAWGHVPAMAHLSLAVNVSALQFAQTDFVEQVMTIVQRTGANPRRLKLELTESLLVSNVDDMVDKMAVLKASGIGFSLDDFGTGFSSLTYLSRLPLDQLKIDRSFVNDVLSNPDDAAIARTIIALAHSLKLGVIAEGVETDAQRAFLADSGCHAYQGYLFSRPLSLEDFEAYVRQPSTETGESGARWRAARTALPG